MTKRSITPKDKNALSRYAVLLSALLAFPLLTAAQTAITIGNYADLCKIGVDADYPLSGSYMLTRNIDASDSRAANGGAGFVPIGSLSAPFTGSFDGSGHTVSGLYINRTNAAIGRNVGLFGVLDSAVVSRLTVAADTVAGNTGVGALAGRAEYAAIDSCVVSGAIIGSSNNVGGLIGSAFNTVISRSNTSGSVTGTERVGGLVGSATMTQVRGSFSSSTVGSTSYSDQDAQVGGLIGYSSDTRIASSHSSGSARGRSQVGGLVGFSSGVVIGSYSTATVENEYGRQVGGLIGYNMSEVTSCYYEKPGYRRTVGGDNSTEVGGLIGANRGGAVMACSVSNVSVVGSSMVGGLIGANYGGAVGWCSYKGSYRTNEFDGTVEVQDSVKAIGSRVGGLIGLNQGDVTRSRVDGWVKGEGQVGGLIGVNDSGAIVTVSYSAGHVNGSGSRVGGLVGSNNYGGRSGNSIMQCYSTSEVKGDTVGGLVGYNDYSFKITECYSVGKVRNIEGDDVGIGGLVGYNGSISLVVRSFWDTETSGKNTSAGGTGKVSAIMKSYIFFTGEGEWDFDDVWEIVGISGNYPTFKDAPPPIIVSVFRGGAVRGVVSKALAPKITVRGRVMSVSAPTNATYQIRVINMRGRVVARISASGGGRYSLGRISAGRYLIETRVNGRVINVLPRNI